MARVPIRHLPLLAGLLCILAYGCALAWRTLTHYDIAALLRTSVDDSFYYFQIARHLADGEFSTFDGGITRTNGYHPLWLWLITPAYWIFDQKRHCSPSARSRSC